MRLYKTKLALEKQVKRFLGHCTTLASITPAKNQQFFTSPKISKMYREFLEYSKNMKINQNFLPVPECFLNAAKFLNVIEDFWNVTRILFSRYFESIDFNITCLHHLCYRENKILIPNPLFLDSPPSQMVSQNFLIKMVRKKTTGKFRYLKAEASGSMEF